VVKMRRRGGKWGDLAQRFSFLPEGKRAAIAALPGGKGRLWIHAVSVGEVGIATKLITRLLNETPDTGIVLTTTTPTGHALAEEFAAKMGARVVVLYSPLDLPGVGARMLTLLRPAQIVLVEAEVWPNLVAAAAKLGIPVSLVNARLSPRSEQRFQRFGFLIRPVFAMLHQVLVQEFADVARWTALGVARERLHHTGSIKFDPQGAAVETAQLIELRAVLTQAGIAETQPILLLASTHPGEEALLATVALRLRERHPELALLIVPRHVERAAEIIVELKTLGINARRRSEVEGGQGTPNSELRTLLVDTTGELKAWQCLATLVVVGKSFLAQGGQNPAEAVMVRKPVLFGPHMENFAALVGLLLDHQGALQVPDVPTLENELCALLADPQRQASLGQAGHAALLVHEGATERTVARLKSPT